MAKKTSTTKLQSENLSTVPGEKLNNFLNKFPGNISSYKPSKRDYFILVIIGLLILGVYKKSWFVAAMVNGMPITNLELQSKLNEQFRTQTLNQLINEKIILDEARKGSAIPNEAEIDKKIADLEASVGGKDTLNSLLTQQGQTRNSLRSQIRVQLAITKLYEKEATVSATELSQFLEQNRAQLRATDSAGQQKEAEDALKQQKLSQLFNQKFQELRQKAKIQTF